MKCEKCGHENKDSAKFCISCGNSLISKNKDSSSGSSNSKFVILGLVIVIIVLISVIGYFALNNDNSGADAGDSSSQIQQTSSVDEAGESSNSQESSSSQSDAVKSWQLIGSYSGSGSGSQSVSVPAGEIMVKITAFPIKNYATNHLYVTGSNGESAGVDWGSKSAVASRSDSLSYSSSTPVTFTIEYYETVSWNVDIYRYQ